MVATFDLLEHLIRCEEESTLVSKNKAEQEKRSVSSEIAQYQSMINSYRVKITTDSQNEESTIRGLRERLETAVSDRDEMHLIGQRAAQERDAKMNEEIKIARDRAHKGNALHERATLRDREFDDVTRELAASRCAIRLPQSDRCNG